MRIKKLSPRLQKVAGLIRENTTVCDVGTDHAFLPCYLAYYGENVHIYASDYNEKPLKRAEIEVKRRNFEQKITVMQSNGLENVPKCDDIVIAGMGGELIAEIVENMPDRFKCENLRLILQPMTKKQELRDRLKNVGVEILFEENAVEVTKQKHREYVIFYCRLVKQEL